MAAHIRQYALFELELLGDISWMKSTRFAIACKSVVKDSVPFGGSGANVRRASAGSAFLTAARSSSPFPAWYRPPGRDSEVQRARSPAATDHAGAQQPKRAHGFSLSGRPLPRSAAKAAIDASRPGCMLRLSLMIAAGSLAFALPADRRLQSLPLIVTPDVRRSFCA